MYAKTLFSGAAILPDSGHHLLLQRAFARRRAKIAFALEHGEGFVKLVISHG